MTIWRNSNFIKPLAWLVLCLMAINPALALQYQQLNKTQDLLSKIANYQTKAWHIHISQKEAFISILKEKGYNVIPASQAEAQHFLMTDAHAPPKTIQLAANFNLDKVYVDECSYTKKYCYREECDKYAKQRRQDCPEPEPLPQAKAPPQTPAETTSKQTTVHSNVSISHRGSLNLPNLGGGGSGNGSDAASVMLVVIGVVVIAALFIYAGKWIVDTLKNDEDYYAYWWDIGTHYINLDTDAGEHGNLTGIKFSGGFVPNMHTNFGLTVELGAMDLDLIYNKDTQPERITIEGSYWLIGPSVRWLLGYTDTEQLINNSYFYLELLGGSSDRKEVDKMFIGRIGFNTGIAEHLRLGIHYGAFYLGLDEDQGIANDGDNYWNMYGFEIGYQF